MFKTFFNMAVWTFLVVQAVGCSQHPLSVEAANKVATISLEISLEAGDHGNHLRREQSPYYTTEPISDFPDDFTLDTQPLYKVLRSLSEKELLEWGLYEDDVLILGAHWYQLTPDRVRFTNGVVRFPPLLNMGLARAQDIVLQNVVSKEAWGDLVYYNEAFDIALAEASKEVARRLPQLSIRLTSSTFDATESYRIPINVVTTGGAGQANRTILTRWSSAVGHFYEVKDPEITINREEIRKIVLDEQKRFSSPVVLQRRVTTKIRKLLVHELLHILGLQHAKNETDVLYPNIGAGEMVRVYETGNAKIVRGEDKKEHRLDDDVILIKDPNTFSLFEGGIAPMYLEISSDYPPTDDPSNVVARFALLAASRVSGTIDPSHEWGPDGM